MKIKLEKYGEIFISANQINKQNLKFGLGGKTALLLDKNIESLMVFSTKSVSDKIFVSGDFIFQSTDTLVGKMFMELNANANPYFTFYNDSSNIKSIIEGGISSKDITSFEITKLSQETTKSQFEYKKDTPFNTLGNYFSFELPYVANGVDSWHINLLPTERTVSLEIPEPIHEKYEFAIVFPIGLKPVANIKNIEIRNKAGHLIIKYKESENEIVITREIKFDKKVYGLDIYDDFREIMNVWNNTNYRKIFFKE